MKTSIHALKTLVVLMLFAVALAVPLPSRAGVCDTTIPSSNVSALVSAIVIANNESACPGLDTLYLTNSVYVFTDEYPSPGSGVALPFITSDITIMGNGATLLMEAGAPLMREFYVYPTGNLTLNNTINDGAGAGVLVSVGDLTVTNSTFRNNLAGAAIHNFYGNVNISDSSFDHAGGNNLGALHNIGGNLNVNNTQISNTQWGGIITINGVVHLFDVHIDNNHTSNGVASIGASLYMEESSVTNTNSGTGYGGGLYVQGSNVTILNSVIANNTTGHPPGSITAGGGLSVDGGSLLIRNSEFSNNNAQGGAAIWISGLPTSAQVLDSTFTGNTVTNSYYGGILSFFSTANITVSGNIFRNNQGQQNGTIVSSGGVMTLTGNIIEDNVADNGSAVFIVYPQYNDVQIIAHNNCLTGNTPTAVVNLYSPITMDFTENWWGSFDGPSGVGPGHGDSVSANIDFSDFLTSAPAGCDTIYQPPNSPPIFISDYATTSANEGSLASNGGTITDPDGDNVTLSASVGTVVNNGNGTWSWSFLTSDGPPQNQIVSITGDDGNEGTGSTSFNLVVDNVAPDISEISSTLNPVPINTQVCATGEFDDPSILDTYSASWNWGDTLSSTQNVGAGAGPFTINNCHVYTSPGVYTITLTVTDDDAGSSDPMPYQYVVVYDPLAGFVTGNGLIQSLPGAYAPNPNLGGIAHFGFVSRYQNGANVPTGNTRFRFQIANLDFRSDTYEWLVVAGARAQFKGTGTINGAGNYGFMLTAIDGQINGGGGADRFRIKIWDKTTGAIIYDNQMGAGDNSSVNTVIQAGAITIHSN